MPTTIKSLHIKPSHTANFMYLHAFTFILSFFLFFSLSLHLTDFINFLDSSSYTNDTFVFADSDRGAAVKYKISPNFFVCFIFLLSFSFFIALICYRWEQDIDWYQAILSTPKQIGAFCPNANYIPVCTKYIYFFLFHVPPFSVVPFFPWSLFFLSLFFPFFFIVVLPF